MKKSSAIFEELKRLIHSSAFQKKHKIFEKDFSRKVPLSFSIVILLIINQIKKSIACEIFEFCDYFSKKIFSKSSFSKARGKLSHNAFIELNDSLVQQFYADKKTKKFCGMIVFGIDGYKLQLPDSEEVVDYFGCMKNQNNNPLPGAQCSEIYDVLNKIVFVAEIKPLKTSERDLAISLINKILLLKINTNSDYFIIFDRGYPSILLLLFLIENKIPFLIRSTSKFLKEIASVLKSGKKDQVIDISLKNKSPSDKKEILKHFPNFREMTIKLRVVLVKLKNGETEILITTLFNNKKFKYGKFKKIYFLRWGIEEGIKLKKIRAEIENISGKRIITIRQDFFSTIFLINVMQLLVLEAKKELLNDKKITKRKYRYEINYNVALGKIKNTFVDALMDPDINMVEYSKKMIRLIKMSLEPIRPGRQNPRKCKHPGRRFHGNQRRAA